MRRLAILLAMVLAAACSGESAFDGAGSTTAIEPGAMTTSMALSTTSASTTTAVEQTATVEVPVHTGGWARVPHDEEVFDGGGGRGMSSVAAGGPGLVAVGVDGSGGDSDAAVWTSVDGLTWMRVPHDEEVFGGAGEQWMESVAVGGPGLVAVGIDGPSGDRDVAVWTSVDGLTWMRVPHDEEVFGGVRDQWMESVAVGGPGLVAVGYADFSGSIDAAVWTSVDGLTWTRVAHNKEAFGGFGRQVMLSVSAGGPGVVAVGTDWSGLDADAAV